MSGDNPAGPSPTWGVGSQNHRDDGVGNPNDMSGYDQHDENYANERTFSRGPGEHQFTPPDKRHIKHPQGHSTPQNHRGRGAFNHQPDYQHSPGVAMARGRGVYNQQYYYHQSPGNGNHSQRRHDNRPPDERHFRRSPSGGRQGERDWRNEMNRSSSSERSHRNYNSNSSYNDSFSPQHGRQRDDRLVFLSKTLSSILRHNAERFGFTLMKGGFLYVNDILENTRKLHGYTVEDVEYVVKSNDKQRFTLEQDDKGWLKIRANQGHSMEVDDLDLKPITDADDFPNVVHGTYYEAWNSIKVTGLNRMKRNHIHFAPGTPGASGVISGMRSSCEVMIYLDLEKALKDGIKFFVSSNNVILTPGDESGAIHPRYFMGAKDRKHGHKLDFNPQVETKSREQSRDQSKGKRKRGGQGKRDGKNNDQREGAHLDKRASETPPKTQAPNPKPTTSYEADSSSDVSRSTDQNVTGSDSVDDVSSSFTSQEVSGSDVSHETQSPGKPALSKKQKLEPDNVRTDEASRASGSGTLQQLQEDYKEPEEDGVKEIDIEPVVISETDISKVTVQELIDDGPDFVVVICRGENLGEENSRLHELVVGTDKALYVFSLENEAMMTEGLLKELLLHKTINKVFCGISEVSSSLINQYDILMNSVPIWDLEILYDKLLDQLSAVDKDTIKQLGFHKEMFEKWAKTSQQHGLKTEDLEALKQQALMMRRMFPIFQKRSGPVLRVMKKEIFDKAMPEDVDTFLSEKITRLKLELKQQKEKKKAKPETNQEASTSVGKSTGKPAGKQTGGKKNNKKRK